MIALAEAALLAVGLVEAGSTGRPAGLVMGTLMLLAVGAVAANASQALAAMNARRQHEATKSPPPQ